MTTYDSVVGPESWICASCGQARNSHHESHHAFVRDKVEFVAMLRIRNEARWIAEVIEAALPLCSRIFILDDHSEDGTVRICERYKEVAVYQSPFSGLNEARDKNWIYDQIMVSCEPRWILCIDGDEILEERGPDIIREHVKEHPCHAYSLKIAFFWNNRETLRVDRIYGDFWRPSLFAPFHPDPDKPDHIKILKECRFMCTPFGRKKNGDEPNLHCSSVPQRFLHGHERCPARLKHYGYMHREDRVRKLDFYTGCDWLDKAEDCYRHMTQGDDPKLEELPIIRSLLTDGTLSMADVQYMLHAPITERLIHAGPLELAPFTE